MERGEEGGSVRRSNGRRWGYAMRLSLKSVTVFVVSVSALAAATSPAQALIDADADGFSQAADCNDGDPRVWAVPGEAVQLSFAADKATISWVAPSALGGQASSVRYDTLRSTSPSIFAAGPPSQCFDPEGLTTTSTDASVPPAGTAYYYLVRAKNDCGVATLGPRTGGIERPGMICDCAVLCNDSIACTRDYCADGACAHDALAPLIQAQPASAAACPGEAAAFTIRASGQGTLHYQWKKGAVNVGTDSPTLAFSVAGADNAAQITCSVTDTCSTTSSAAATLTVFATAASCSGGGNGLEAPNGASDPVVGSAGGQTMQICHRTGSCKNPYTIIRTSAAACGGHSGHVPDYAMAGSGGGSYLFSGEFYLEATDLAIAGRGFDFEWTRKYRSREGRLTPMGQGWDFSYNRSVAAGPAGSRIVSDGNSRRDTYVTGTGSCWTATGFFRELCLQVDNTYVLTFPNRTTWKFAALDGSPAQGRIVRIQDSNSNAMTFAYDGAGKLTTITDTLGRPITVSYTAEGFVSAVTDFAGRQVTYGYGTALDADGSPGDLRTATSPSVTGTPTGNDFPAGKTTTYTYSRGTLQAALDHNLLTVADPTGSVVLRNVYTPVTNPASARFDRLDRQVLPSGTMDYVYIAQTPGPGEDAVTKTCFKDKAGNVTEASFDASNRLVKLREYTGRALNLVLPTDDVQNRPVAQLRPTDPAYFETRLTWSPSSLLLTATLPEGNTITNTYDSANSNVRLRANLLQSVQSPGPRGGDQPQISETWGYTTLFGDEPCVCKGCCGEGGERPASQSFDHHYVATADEVGSRWIQQSWDKGYIPKPLATAWTSHTDGLGRTTTRSIDPITGNLLQSTAPVVTTGVLGGGTQNIVESWEYTAFGQVTRHIDPTGRNDTQTFYTSGPQTGYLQNATVDAPGSLPGSHFVLLTVTARDAFGNMTTRTDPSGHTESFAYNQLDQLVRHVSSPPFSYRTDTYYDAADRVVSKDVQNVDENGAVESNAATSTLYYYDALSRLVRRRVEPDTVVIDTEYQYDANDNLTLERRPEAVNGHQPTNVEHSLYDERDRLFRQTLAEGDLQASTTQTDYDKNGNVVATRRGLEATPEVSTSGYDGYDRVISSTDPMGNLKTRQYDANGNVTFVHVEGELTDGESGPNVRLTETTSTYDEVDRLIRSDAAFFDTVTGSAITDGSVTWKYFYDANSRPVRKEDDNSHGTNTAYDTAGRLSATTDAAGNSRTIGYDADSNVLTTTVLEISDLGTAPQSFVTTYAYDALERRITTTDSIGNVEHDLYNSRGNVKSHIDARGNQTLSAYDGANRLVSTARKMTDTGDGSGAVTFVLDGTRSQDDEGRLVSQTDDNGNATTYQYDALNRRIATLYPDGTADTTTYDVHGNATQVVDANGSLLTATFDADDRLKTRSISRAAGVVGTTSETWKYDGLSRVVYAQNDGSLVTRKYDSQSDVTQETLQIGAGPVRTMTATFDGAGNRLSMVYPAGVTVTRTNDLLDRAKTISTSGPRICSNGPTPGIVCTSNPVCGAGGVCQPPLAAGTANYDYAGPDRVVRRKCCAASANEQLDVVYDNARRMTRTTHARLTPPGLIDDHAYGWDPVDDKTSRTQLLSPGTGRSDSYAYDSASRLVHAVESPTSLPPIPIDYALDGVGNRTTVTGGTEAGAYTMSAVLSEPADRQLNQYTSTPFDGTRDYDRNGNLLHKSGTGETLSYDYRNRMVQVNGPGGTHTYAYDSLGRRILADGSQFFSIDNDTVQQLTATGAFKSAQVYGDRIDDMVMGAQDVDGNGSVDRVAYHADDMGNVMAVTNGIGTVLEKYDYDNFGKPRFFDAVGSPIAQSAIGNPWLFNGHRYDSETGLYDYRTRYFDPRAGRFTSRDTIGTWGDDGNLGNGNAYAGNNPWSAVDPMGTSVDAYLRLEDIEPRKHVCPCVNWAPPSLVCYCYSGINVGGGGGGETTNATTAPPAPRMCAQGVCNGISAPGGSGGGPAAMTKGTVKFFNEAKGFGFSKLCPGHPSCPPPSGGASDGAASMKSDILHAQAAEMERPIAFSGGDAAGGGPIYGFHNVGGDLWFCSCDPSKYNCTNWQNWHCTKNDPQWITF